MATKKQTKRLKSQLPLITKAFRYYFWNWSIKLPRDDVKARRRGRLFEKGWVIDYLFGEEDGREYLDFYASNRMTNDRHIRVYEDGEEKGLPALCYEFPMPGVDNDKLLEELNKKWRSGNFS